MSQQEQLRTLFIETFPELSIADFPALTPEDRGSTWLMDWQSEYASSQHVIAGCEFSNFGWLLEQKFQTLSVVKSSQYDISDILKNIFAYIEQFEDHSAHELINFTEVEYDASLFDDDELSFEEQYAIAMDNITAHILQHDLSVIILEHGENVDFILSQAPFHALSKLEKMLKIIYTDRDVTLYHQQHKQDYQFENLLSNLE